MNDRTVTSRRRGLAVRFVLSGLLAVALWPAPAAGHGTEGLDESDYLVTVTDAPDIPGVTVRTVETGSRLELVNSSTRPVEILGYAGEPYAEVRPDGLYLNRNSPAVYLNETTDSRSPVPAFASPAASPQWRLVSTEPRIRWHDHRAGWMAETPPPAVAADPTSNHRVLKWTVPLRVGTVHHVIAGTVDWLAPPRTPVWIAAALLLAATTAAAALTAVSRPRWRLAVPALVTVAGIAALVDAVGRSATAADFDDSWLTVLVAGQAWPALAGLAGVAAAVYTFIGKPGAELAWGLAGAMVALMAGLTRFGSFTSALTPTPWTGGATRTMVLLALGLGSGLAAAALITVRRSG